MADIWSQLISSEWIWERVLEWMSNHITVSKFLEKFLKKSDLTLQQAEQRPITSAHARAMSAEATLNAVDQNQNCSSSLQQLCKPPADLPTPIPTPANLQKICNKCGNVHEPRQCPVLGITNTQGKKYFAKVCRIEEGTCRAGKWCENANHRLVVYFWHCKTWHSMLRIAGFLVSF